MNKRGETNKLKEKRMETFEQYNLMFQKRWTEFLKALKEGESIFTFPSLSDIQSCKTIAYAQNTNRTGRTYQFKVDKDLKRVSITVNV